MKELASNAMMLTTSLLLSYLILTKETQEDIRQKPLAINQHRNTEKGANFAEYGFDIGSRMDHPRHALMLLHTIRMAF